ncbi:uncharacterized protein LTR77_009412 [Saxophila tyrrhenica]|uniref:C2H2-type domain-containing protein n=1 Tax=Saxophila tyrrhenica TaxID=1690608 RepID=A0AAV9NXL3_9PEZI|nr:hypothetical protein LTR77_009412 [Saxophila tyrrhenica]
MAFNNDLAMPAYMIYRDIPAGQPMDLTAPLAFFPPKDSDELFDALRMTYPHLKSHSERIGQAVIDYLLEENIVPEQLPTPQTSTSTNFSPWEASMQSMSEGSTWSSPDMLGLATPSFGNSPQPQHSQPLTRQSTVGLSNSENTPALDQMTSVFSLSDSTQPKQRVRRKMTDAEKAEYRKRRIVKACDKCSKRKRKCHHNQPEMENISTKTNKVTKPIVTTPPKNQAHQHQQQHVPDPFIGTAPFDQSMTANICMPSFDDFTMLPEDPMFDNNMDFGLSDWPWNDVPDWTHLGMTDSNYQINDHRSGSSSQGLAQGGPLTWDNQHANQHAERVDVPREPQQATHTRHLHESYGPENLQQPMLESVSQGNATDDSLGWQHLALHDRDREHPEPGRHVPGATPAPALAQMTLRLTGTKKAVQAFGDLLSSRSSSRSSLQKVSLSKIALVALAGLSTAQSLTGPERIEWTLSRPDDGITIEPHRSRASGVACRSPSMIERRSSPRCSSSFRTQGDLARHAQLVHHATDQCDPRSQLYALTEPAAGGQHGEYLQTSPRRTRTEATSRIPLLQSSDRTGASGSRQALSSETSNSSSRSQSAQQSPLSLGAGIMTSKSPTMELYSLKHRSPQGLLERGNATAARSLLLPAEASRATQVNGGAYPRLETTPAGNKSAGAIAGSTNRPTHSRPTAPANNAHTDLQSSPDLTRADGQVVTFKSHSHSGLATQSTHNMGSTANDFAYRTPTHNEVAFFRLEDHVRRRDHFGRSSSALAAWAVSKLLMILVGLGVLWLLSMAETRGISLGVVLLASVAPVPRDGGIPTAWNSAWSNPESHAGVDADSLRSVQKRLAMSFYSVLGIRNSNKMARSKSFDSMVA